MVPCMVEIVNSLHDMFTSNAVVSVEVDEDILTSDLGSFPDKEICISCKFGNLIFVC
jgi:hypothetical protein